MTLVLRLKTPGWLNVLVGKRACSANVKFNPWKIFKNDFSRIYYYFPKIWKIVGVSVMSDSALYFIESRALQTLTPQQSCSVGTNNVTFYSVGTSMNSNSTAGKM